MVRQSLTIPIRDADQLTQDWHLFKIQLLKTCKSKPEFPHLSANL